MKRRLMRACLKCLRSTFGVEGFRPGQKAACDALLSGRDLLCILTTGAGKSLCWQLPAVMHAGLTVVVSPLIALMDDQVQSLHRRGIPAVTLNSLMSREERAEAMAAVRSGKVRIVLVSPERLETESFRRLTSECPPWLLVVDEAHCIVQWGDDFRTAYGKIGGYVSALARRPVLCAMTATADAEMQQAIIDNLCLSLPRRVTLPIIRENLRYQVRTTVNRTAEVLRIAAKQKGRIIIFCHSRARCENLAHALRMAGLMAEHYHAGLNQEERQRVQEQFRAGEVRLLAATTAFGMGVDIPGIRCVIHDSLPSDITDLVQQSGRAGRDGEPADCIFLLDARDLVNIGSVLTMAWKVPWWRFLLDRNLRREAWLPKRSVLRIVLTAHCIPAGISSAFGQRAAPCGVCSACRKGPLLSRVPPLPYLSRDGLHRWLLRWQRDAIAKKRGVRPGTILSETALGKAARTLTLPEMEDASVREALERLMASLRRENANKSGKVGQNTG